MTRLTVITVVKNNLPGLIQTYGSLREQANQDFRWLVVDGESTDGTLEWLARIDRPLFNYSSQKDRSLFEAMNKAIDRLETDYCLFLNGGDFFWDKDVMDRILKTIEEKPFLVSYGKFMLGGVSGFKQRQRGERIRTCIRMFYGPVPCHQSMVISREAFRENGPYKENLGIYGDAEWIIRYSKRRHPSTFTYMPFIIPYYDPKGVSYSRFFKYRGIYFRMLRDNGSPLEVLAGMLGWSKTALYILLSRLAGLRKQGPPG